jgi:hypothetical protein
MRAGESALHESEVTMTASYIRRFATVSLCTAFAVLLSSTHADPTASTGDLWEVTSQMSMEGYSMKMPAQKSKVCAAKVWTRPPGGDNEERGCTSSEFVRSETEPKVTWTSVCQDGMAGQGEITLNGDDAYSGTIRYASNNGNVLISLEGRRVGECNNPQ